VFLNRPKDKKDGPPDNAGAGATWLVRGGNFKFRVSSVFAISSATVDGTAVKTPYWYDTDGNRHDVDPILSIPMHVANASPPPITSPLSIDITPRAERRQLDGTMNSWKSEFVVKTVPTALWGDWANKPNVLDASQRSLVHLPMAVEIAAPPPTLARSNIKPVNATDIMKQLVEEVNLAPTEKQDHFFPQALASTPKTKDEKVAAWNAMQETWEKTKMGDAPEVAKKLVDSCISALGWDKPAPDVLAKVKDMQVKPWELKAQFPSRLVTGTGDADAGDGLKNTYLALPRLVNPVAVAV